MNYRLFPLLALSVFVPTMAFADMIPENSHPVQGCLRIENAASFPAYNFLLVGISRYSYAETITAQERCDLPGGGELLAIRKADLGKVHYRSMDDEDAGIWPRDAVNAPFIIQPGLEVKVAGEYAMDTDPMVEEHQVLHIDRVDAQGVTAHVARLTTKDANGRTKVVISTVPAATSTPVTPPVAATATPVVPVVVPIDATASAPTVMNEQAPAQVIIYRDRDNTNYFLLAIVALIGVLGLGLVHQSWKK